LGPDFGALIVLLRHAASRFDTRLIVASNSGPDMAHPNQDRCHGVDQRHGPAAEYAIRVVGALLTQLARQVFAGGVSVARGE
jgi:hypothetical protein